MSEADRQQFARATWANVIGNAAKIAVEVSVGLVFGSVGLLADAAHSVVDLVGSLVVLIWGQSAYEEPDVDHPHGHGRIEPLSALFVGSLIVLLGGWLLIESGSRIVYGSAVKFDQLLLVALTFAIASMFLVYRYTERINEQLGSPALAALAADCRNDIYTSIAVLIGVIGITMGLPILDPIAGALVSLLVIYQGLQIGRENVAYIVGAAPDRATREAIASSLRSHPAVEGMHDLRVFYDGPDLEVEVHVEVDGDLTLRRAHEIETTLASRLRERDDVRDVHVHMDPSGIGEWKDSSETT
ncbi:MAG: cation diffusion facilitator family transporter [Natrialbaceae archaeon]|nr:cation diffusion facilitator family transporter [Natrialbaceae archaeon]